MLTASKNVLTTAVVLALTVAIAIPQTFACPSCEFPSLTLAESLAQTDAAILVQWASGKKPTEDSAGNTTYEVKQILRNYKGKLKVGDRVTLPRYRASKIGDLFVLMGSQQTTLEWGSPLEVTETAFNYISQAPSPEVPTVKRLEYYAKFLEYSDPMIANDAYGEFANSPYKDVAAVAEKIPREKVRKWVTSPDTPGTRLGLYGLMIGVCGNKDDEEMVRKKIVEKTDEFRLGIDGLMSGYLVLAGDKGLDVIDDSKLKDSDVPFSETYAAMQALRFMWRYGEGRRLELVASIPAGRRFQVDFHIARSAGLDQRLLRRSRQRRATEPRVQHDSGGIDHSLQLNPLRVFGPRRHLSGNAITKLASRRRLHGFRCGGLGS